MGDFDLTKLEAIIAERAQATDGSSYTRKLLDAGPARCAKKLGEEAVEAVIAITGGQRNEIVSESADVLYHLLVALKGAGIPISEVFAELQRRTARSGLDEKASRPPGTV